MVVILLKIPSRSAVCQIFRAACLATTMFQHIQSHFDSLSSPFWCSLWTFTNSSLPRLHVWIHRAVAVWLSLIINIQLFLKYTIFFFKWIDYNSLLIAVMFLLRHESKLRVTSCVHCASCSICFLFFWHFGWWFGSTCLFVFNQNQKTYCGCTWERQIFQNKILVQMKVSVFVKPCGCKSWTHLTPSVRLYGSQCKSSLLWQTVRESEVGAWCVASHGAASWEFRPVAPWNQKWRQGGRCETVATWAVSYSCVCHNFFFLLTRKVHLWVPEVPVRLSSAEDLVDDMYIAPPQPFSCPVCKYMACGIN